MKKIKKNNKYYYKNNEFLLDNLKNNPINIREHINIIDKIHEKYPLLSKSEISIIVKYSLETFRELLLFGNIINFNKLFFDMKLHIFKQIHNGVIFPSLKVKVSTPPRIKK